MLSHYSPSSSIDLRPSPFYHSPGSRRPKAELRKPTHMTITTREVSHVTKLYTVFDIKDDEFTAVKSFDYFFAK